jgi:hypothetical protein
VKVLEDATADGTGIGHPHIWTTGGPEDRDRIHLAVPNGRAVFFDTGPGGVIMVSIEDGQLVLFGEMGDLIMRPRDECQIRVTASR